VYCNNNSNDDNDNDISPRQPEFDSCIHVRCYYL